MFCTEIALMNLWVGSKNRICLLKKKRCKVQWFRLSLLLALEYGNLEFIDIYAVYVIPQNTVNTCI